MSTLTEPSDNNDFLAEHIEILSNSLQRWTNRNLIEPASTGREAAQKVFLAPFAVVSHGTSDDPVFNYGNRTALQLFEMDWQQFTALPSRLSAEPVDREQRAKLLSKVSNQGYIEHYQGVRISRANRRFLVNNAIVWNLLDDDGEYYGQAAMFNEWSFL